VKSAYECIVLGIGGIGSGALYWLARRLGGEVLGIEQFRLGHDHGGSQDHSRIIRLSYHAPEYTALTPHTYTAWAEVEAESGMQLVFKTGGLDVGLSGSRGAAMVGGRAAAMRAHGIPFEELTAEEAMDRWPQWRLSEGDRVLYQPDSGLVDARKGMAAQQALARAHGAKIVENAPVRRLTAHGDSVEVETDAGRFSARRLVIAAGAWTAGVTRQLGLNLPITVTQEQVTYFATPYLREFAPDRFPIWICHGDEAYYGFPVYGEVATKAGVDVGGDVVTPETRTFQVNERADRKLRAFLQRYLPRSLGPTLYTKTCLYDMPPDRNFIIDTLPDHPHVAVAQGAAHVFKFSCLVGRILSQLVLDGRSDYPIASFTLNRPALTDPTFQPTFRLDWEAPVPA